MVVDLRELGFIDSSGIRTVLGIADEVPDDCVSSTARRPWSAYLACSGSALCCRSSHLTTIL